MGRVDLIRPLLEGDEIHIKVCAKGSPLLV